MVSLFTSLYIAGIVGGLDGWTGVMEYEDDATVTLYQKRTVGVKGVLHKGFQGKDEAAAWVDATIESKRN
jgi:hypothetical protein